MNLQSVCISKNLPIKDALQILNDGHMRIVLVLDGEGHLEGVVSDSDIRRAILRGVTFDLPVEEIMVRKPLVASQAADDKEILALMKRFQIHQIPILDQAGKVVDIKLIDDILPIEDSPEAFVFVGGKGVRLHPITEHVPKPLLEVGGQPILFYILDGLLASGVNRITLGLNYKGEMIEAAIGNVPRYQRVIRFVREDSELGTAGALSLFEAPPNKPLIVMNGDILSKVDFRSMVNFHLAERNMATVAVRGESVQIPFGVVDLSGSRITKIVEKPKYEYHVSAGIYIFEPSMLSLIPRNVRIDMPGLLDILLEKSLRVGSFPVHEYWLDIGRHSELEKAQVDFQKHF